MLAAAGWVVRSTCSGNRGSIGGRTYTGAVVQYEADGILDAHHIFAQLDEVKYQYGCFPRSLLGGGPGVVSRPAPLGSECVFAGQR